MSSSNPCRNHWGQLPSERKRGAGASAVGTAPPKPRTGSPRLLSAQELFCICPWLGLPRAARPQTPPQEAAKKQLFRRRACPFPGSWEAVRVWGGGSHPWGTRLGRSPAPEGTPPDLFHPHSKSHVAGHRGPRLGAWGEPGWTLPTEGGVATRAGPAEQGKGSSLHWGPGLGPPTATMYSGHCTGGACCSPGHPEPVPSHSCHQVGQSVQFRVKD